VGILNAPTVAGAQACGDVIRSERVNHNAVLPTGYGATSWGMSAEAVQAVRGRQLESQPDLSNKRVHKLFETLTEEKGIASIHYTFYDDRLMKVVLYLNQDIIEVAESLLVGDLQEEYGEHTHQFIEELDDREVRQQIRTHPDKYWIWCDTFTEQILQRRPDKGEVLIIRQSRFIYDDLLHQTTDQQEKENWTKLNNLDTK